MLKFHRLKKDAKIGRYLSTYFKSSTRFCYNLVFSKKSIHYGKHVNATSNVYQYMSLNSPDELKYCVWPTSEVVFNKLLCGLGIHCLSGRCAHYNWYYAGVNYGSPVLSPECDLYQGVLKGWQAGMQAELNNPAKSVTIPDIHVS